MRVLRPALVIAALTSSTASSADDKAACIAAAESGQVALAARRLAEAGQLLRRCSSPTCPKVVRESCEVWLSEASQLQPTFVFGARDAAGKELGAVRILVDGKEPPATVGGTVPLDPGQHRITFVHATLGSEDLEIVASERVKGREVVLKYGPQGKMSSGARARTASELKPSRTPYLLGGVGAAALLASGYLYLQYSSKLGALSRACGDDRMCPASESDNIDSARTAGRWAAITGVLGIAAIGAGAWLHWSENDRRSASVGVSPDGAVFAKLGGKF